MRIFALKVAENGTVGLFSLFRFRYFSMPFGAKSVAFSVTFIAAFPLLLSATTPSQLPSHNLLRSETLSLFPSYNNPTHKIVFY